MRQPFIAGNWKMNPSTEAEALALATDVATRLGAETCAIMGGETVDEDSCTEVVIFPPFPFISKVKDVVKGVDLKVGAQNFYYRDSGAFTGSVSAPMVQSVGCKYVLCGHSERRTLFADSDVNINLKVRRTFICLVLSKKDAYPLTRCIQLKMAGQKSIGIGNETHFVHWRNQRRI